ncbi:hypothetical protein M0R45_001989 [Rubus argutus]|uniref:Uncharacterized protein n=1 Tax=Rubus argutus TaxID=59490 RepID=A0AAW1VNC9_RUBAR
MKMKDVEVDLWLNRKGLPSNFKEVIMNFIQQKLEQNEDVEVENILSVLPSAHRKYITLYLRLAALKKVRMLQTMGGSASKKLQHIISKVMRDQLPSPVSALDRN